MLAGQRPQHRGLGVPPQGGQPVNVPGKQVVVDDACVLGPVFPDDVVVVEVLEPGAVRGFASPPVAAIWALITSLGTRSAIVPLTVLRPPVILSRECWTVMS